MIDFNSAAPQIEAVDPAEWDRRLERLRAELRQRTREVVGTIFPLARIHGSDARIGSIDGERGESLSIGLDGDRAGLWTDHATNEGGDLITLWQMTSGSREFPEAVRELEEWLGLVSARPRFATRVQRVADERQAHAKTLPKAEAETLGAPVATYHYLAADAVTVLGIVRRYETGGVDDAGKPKKTFRPQRPDGKAGMPDVRPLYRIPQITSASEVVLVEGEKCADALDSLGISATTQMGGANADPQKTDWKPLAGKSVAVWQDNDAAGSGLTERVRASLEAIGCRVRVVVVPPGKPRGWDAADAVAEGLDVAGFLEEPRAEKVRRESRFRILDISEIGDIEPPEWRIDGIFPSHGTSALYGAPGSLKTFAALDMAMHMASGRDWLGRLTKPGRVLYVAGEGQVGIARRIMGWCVHNDVPMVSPRFSMLPHSVAMPTGEVDELMRAIDGMAEEPTLIVLDTITRMFGAGSQNKDEDMSAYIRGTERLGAHTSAHVMSIGHSGKDKERGLFGSMLLMGALDTIICASRTEAGVTLSNAAPLGKQKEGEEFEDIALRSQVVRFSHRAIEHSTLVLRQMEPPQPSDEVKAPRLGKVEKGVLEAVERGLYSGRVLGTAALVGMTGFDGGSVRRALRTLREKACIPSDYGTDEEA